MVCGATRFRKLIWMRLAYLPPALLPPPPTPINIRNYASVPKSIIQEVSLLLMIYG